MKIRTLCAAVPLLLLKVLPSAWAAGTVGISWELSPPPVAAKGEYFQATASASYNPNLPAGKEWEYGSLAIGFEWQANPDGTMSGRSDTATGGSGGSVFYKSNVTIEYDAASAQVNDKTVKVRAHITGSLLDYGPDGQKGTADDVTYTIDQWSDWLEKQLTVFIMTVSPSKTFIVAGAKADSVHSSLFTLTVSPLALGGLATFQIVSGTGDGKDNRASLSTTAVQLVSGQAQTTITSSDLIERVDVEAQYAQSSMIASVWDEPPSCQWQMAPEYLETTCTTTVVLTHGGSKVVGHSVTFRVFEVQLINGEHVTDNLEQYASFDVPTTVITDATGTAAATLRAGEQVGGCSVIYVGIDDNDVWFLTED